MDMRTERTEAGFDVVIDNREFIPITVDVRLQLDNLISSRGPTFQVVVPADTAGFVAATLRVDKPARAIGLDAGVTTTYGDQTREDYDRNHLYELPFGPGTRQRVEQGYDGRFSHAGENAIDFDLTVGTPIHAARGGVVVDLEDSHDRSCNRPSCMDFNNYVLIYHDDGTMADYAHLRKDGVAVERGQRVAAGELLGYSGNTGYTSGPHLHFVVFLSRGAERETLPTRFRTTTAAAGELLREGSSYERPRQ